MPVTETAMAARTRTIATNIFFIRFSFDLLPEETCSSGLPAQRIAVDCKVRIKKAQRLRKDQYKLCEGYWRRNVITGWHEANLAHGFLLGW
jgi:hypothetical protein